ncbi:MAG: S-layer homology domain-containing protein [Clostridiales bacterium]|nr:S-layer homology domain-containing protein [Clostridiales bacterium]
MSKSIRRLLLSVAAPALLFLFFIVAFPQAASASPQADIKYSPLFEASLKNTLREFDEKESGRYERRQNGAVTESAAEADEGDSAAGAYAASAAVATAEGASGAVATAAAEGADSAEFQEYFGLPGVPTPIIPSYTSSYSCGATCGATCGSTCGATCGATCGSTCGSTCAGSSSCAGSSTCAGASSCAGSSTCFGASSCAGSSTCVGSSSCVGASTCAGSSTCVGMSTCAGGSTCVGTNTCVGQSSCAGNATCFGTNTCSGTNTCMTAYCSTPGIGTTPSYPSPSDPISETPEAEPGADDSGGEPSPVGAEWGEPSGADPSGGEPSESEPSGGEPSGGESSEGEPSGGEAAEEGAEPSGWAAGDVAEAISLRFVPTELRSRYQNAITRREFCALAIKALRASVSQYPELGDIMGAASEGGNPFTDVDDSAVTLAYNLGIVNGVGESHFNPDGAITRQEAATMLANLSREVLGMEIGSAPLDYGDAAGIADWAAASVGFVTEHGIMSGVGDGLFDPLSPYSREQSIVTILRLSKVFAAQ